jgi:DNA polymerase-3 subunit gamma/tau
LALYREWRPQTFADVVGQEHVVRTLKNALATGNVAHAYLFCGPRGTGKTTIARLLAKAINCRSPRHGEPCNACDSCIAVAHASSIDVIEIDGASYGLVDDIRDLREKIQMAPSGGGRRVYIIDEVHMLGRGAFAALLKTIEEPPPHAVLILATTEPQKVPLTITSRCQRFEFHRLTVGQIDGQLRKVLAAGKVSAEDEVARTIARKAEGSLRDALTLLDQCLAFATGPLTMDDVRSVLGSVKDDVLLTLAGYVAAGDLRGCLETVAALVDQGEDLRQLLKDLVAMFRDLLVLRLSPDTPGLTLSADPAKLAEAAQALAVGRIRAILGILLGRDNEMRWSGQPRLILEMALLEAAGPEPAATSEVENARDEARAAGEGTPAKARGAGASASRAKPGAKRPSKAVEPGAKGSPPAGAAAHAAAASPPGKAPPATADQLGQVQAKWTEFSDQLKKKSVSTHALLREAEPAAFDGRQLVIGFNHSALRDLASRDEHRRLIEGLLSELLGQKVAVSCRLSGEVKAEVAAGAEVPAGAEPGQAGKAEDPLVKAAREVFGDDVVEVDDQG